jgi:hypothetical protein
MKKSTENIDLTDFFIQGETEYAEKQFSNKFEKIFTSEDLKKNFTFGNEAIVKILELKCSLEKERTEYQKLLRSPPIISLLPIDLMDKNNDLNIALCNIILSKKKLDYSNFQNYLLEIEKIKSKYLEHAKMTLEKNL